jgi:histidinol-phosphate aminotransferase
VDLDDVLRRVTDRTKAVMLCSPHNPATTIIRRGPLLGFLDALGSDSPLVVLDQAYIDFCEDSDHADGIGLLEHYPRLVVLRTFSKIAGLAGLRVGYAIASAETIDRFNRVRAPYNVNRLGQIAALAALEDHAHTEKTKQLVLEERAYLSAELTKRGYAFPPSHANFLLVAVPDAPGLRTRLMRSGILVRDGAGIGFPGHLRFSVGLRDTNQKLLSLL